MSKIRNLGWKPSGSSDAAVAKAILDVIAEQADR
jgi:hypothetical protein